ncbi:putative metallophosphoesterase [compost metagenome]
MRWKKKRLLYIIPLLLAAAIAFSYFENNAIGVTTFKVSSPKLPEGTGTYRIVQLSDVHSKWFGKNQQRLVRKVSRLKPDLIVVTGDLIDSRKYNNGASLVLMKQLVELVPVYYVTGNHEFGSNKFIGFKHALDDMGVHVLRNRSELLQLGDGAIRIAGVDDPVFNKEADGDVDKINQYLDAALQDAEDRDVYTILLSHRPELFEVYVQRQIDLTFSGHAHGGQVRLPFIGGLVAPGQGFLPQYDAGRYEAEDSTMIVSRGLGNSIIPQRLFNRPEVVLLELSRSSE